MTILTNRPVQRTGQQATTLRAPGLDWLLMLASLALVTMGVTPYDSAAVIKLSGDVVDELSAVLAAFE